MFHTMLHKIVYVTRNVMKSYNSAIVASKLPVLGPDSVLDDLDDLEVS